MPWNRSSLALAPLVLAPFALVWPCSAHAAEVPVATAAELVAAIANAAPGDEIILAPGDYLLANKLSCTAAGTAAQPIVVRAETLGTAKIQVDSLVGFHVQAERGARVAR